MTDSTLEMSGKTVPASPSIMSSPSTRVEERNRTEEDNFKRRLLHLRKAVVAAFVCHILVTILVMSMGYSRGGVNVETGEKLYFSPSIVFFGFGCLTTCVFAGVEAWTMLEGTSPSAGFPDWMFHNNGFLSSAGNMFFLSLFMLPALVVFMLHGHGEEFFQDLKDQSSGNPELFGLILAHIFLGGFVFMADGITIIRQTNKLKQFSGDEDDDDEAKEEAKEEEMSDDEDDGDEKTQLLTTKDRLLAYITLLSHLLFEIGLIQIAGREVNSGTTGSAVIFGMFLIVWIVFAWRSRNKTTTSESWLLHYRLATLFHFFVFLCLFWVSLGVLLFIEVLGTDFWDTLRGLPAVAQFQCILLLLLFGAQFFVYCIILNVHSKNMWSIDEIMTIRKIAQDQGALIDAVRDKV